MRNLILLLLSACLLLSCNDSDTKTIDAGEFTIEIPENWVYEVRQGFDSYAAGIIMTKGQEAIVDLGTWSNPLDVDAGKHDIFLETIDGKEAKVVSPKSVGDGTTGVYFEHVETSYGGAALDVSGTNLNQGNQEVLLEAIRTIRFKH